MNLNIYSVSDKYINYLRKFENKIYKNKENERIYSRKFVGVVLTVNEFNYYIPMSSPKKSDYIDSNNKINSNKIIKYAKTVYNQKIKNCDIGYIKNTVDFKKLEEKLKQWNEENN